MTEKKFETIMEDLDDLLEAERAALLSGNLDKIGRLLARKESLIEELSVLEEYEASALKEMTAKIKRNQDLLDHALEGIRRVAQRLAVLRRVRSSLDTYDASGARLTIDVQTEGSIEKRA